MTLEINLTIKEVEIAVQTFNNKKGFLNSVLSGVNVYYKPHLLLRLDCHDVLKLHFISVILI